MKINQELGNHLNQFGYVSSFDVRLPHRKNKQTKNNKQNNKQKITKSYKKQKQKQWIIFVCVIHPLSIP